MLFKLSSNLIKSRIVLINNCFKRQIGAQKALKYEKHLKRFPLITCKELYDSQHWKWYLRSAPKNGVEVNVECVDTKPNDKLSTTIVALHGCPGSHMDFALMTEHFGDKYRVIVPNFPDFSVTENKNCFWHSAKEKAQYVRDVLKAQGINKIDCLVVHSSAVFPASYLWLKDNELNNDFEIKSLCLLSNPGPEWFTIKGRIVTSTFTNIARVRPIRQYLRKIWSKDLSKRLGIRNNIERYDDLALLMSTYILSDTLTVAERLQKLREQKIPTLSVFSSRDKLFKEEIFYSMLEVLNPDFESYDIFEEYNNFLIQKATKENWIKVVNIRGGGHYVFSTHSPIVHEYIEELLKKVTD